MTVRTVAFILSFRCPLRCRHCLQAARKDNGLPQSIFPEEDLRAAILSLAGSPYSTAFFSGGEPTVHPRLLAAGIDACRRVGLTSMVVSAPVWARSPELARRTLRRIPRFDVLILSYDNYHLEYLTPSHYETAVAAARERGIQVAVNIAHASEAERDDLVRSISPLKDRLCFLNCQPIIPSSREIFDRGIRVSGTSVASSEDLDRLPRSCRAGDVLVNFNLQTEFCCWSNTVPDPPLRFTCARGGELGETLAKLEQDRTFQAFRQQGFLGLLSPEGRSEIAKLAEGRVFVNECHLCTFAMNREHRAVWDRHVNPESETACAEARA